MKRCFKCFCVKPLDKFYKHNRMADGHLNKCIECTKRDVSAHRQANLERIRAYDAMRASQPHRMRLRQRVEREYRAANPERVRAASAVARAVRNGSLQRWPCEICGNTKSLAHHPDYTRPLLVTWLCQPHHKQAHALAKGN